MNAWTQKRVEHHARPAHNEIINIVSLALRKARQAFAEDLLLERRDEPGHGLPRSIGDRCTHADALAEGIEVIIGQTDEEQVSQLHGQTVEEPSTCHLDVGVDDELPRLAAQLSGPEQRKQNGQFRIRQAQPARHRLARWWWCLVRSLVINRHRYCTNTLLLFYGIYSIPTRRGFGYGDC